MMRMDDRRGYTKTQIPVFVYKMWNNIKYFQFYKEYCMEWFQVYAVLLREQSRLYDS